MTWCEGSNRGNDHDPGTDAPQWLRDNCQGACRSNTVTVLPGKPRKRPLPATGGADGVVPLGGAPGEALKPVRELAMNRSATRGARKRVTLAVLPKPVPGFPTPLRLVLVALLAALLASCTPEQECPAGRTDEKPSDPIEWREPRRAVGGREYIYHGGRWFSFTFTPPEGYLFRFEVRLGESPRAPSHLAVFILEGEQSQSQSQLDINPYTGKEHGERYLAPGHEACNAVFDDLLRGFKPRE